MLPRVRELVRVRPQLGDRKREERERGQVDAQPGPLHAAVVGVVQEIAR